ncbi:MAG: type II secretion system GspH family protein, partial [Oscillospiraceae bacterium]|nr:type II secretion system GspH family protein [Oscillospiraceae bacterium]
MNRSDQRGFTGTDILVAIAVISLFTGLIVTISYNIYLASVSTTRMSRATYYITRVFERVEWEHFPESPYDDYFTDKLVTYFNETVNSSVARANDPNANTPYRVTIRTRRHIPERYHASGNNQPLDLVRRVYVTVSY